LQIRLKILVFIEKFNKYSRIFNKPANYLPGV